jgi:capsular polysaccharide transport system ATP-binding protein
MSKAGVLLVTHSERMMRSLCTAAAVLENGSLTYYDDVNDAIEQHARNTLGDDYKRSKEFMDE